MNNEAIYNKINELAKKLNEENNTLTRSDLAWELKQFGVEDDSPEISKFVWECCKNSNNSELFKVFVNNSKTNTLIDEFQIPAMLDEGREGDAFSLIQKKLSESNSALKLLDDLSSEKLKLEIMQKTSDLINFVSGTSSINKIQGEAQHIFEKYSQLTASYSTAKTSINNITQDFCELRQSTAEMYRRYALALTDIFGDNIRSKMPQMFDFNSIQFLDVENMHQAVELEYNSIYGKCGELAGELSDNFSKTLKLSASQYSKQADKRLGLALAGVNLISHYVKTNQKTSEMRKEVATLKQSIAHDVATIRTDQVRLLEIYKTLNDVCIPKAEIFAKAAPTVFDDELNALVEKLYSTPEAKDLKAKRDAILDELHTLERRITDAQLSINYYTEHIKENNQTLKSLEHEYKKAKASKPQQPSGFSKVISLGNAQKQYERDIYDWVQNCEPLVNKYEDMIVDVKIEGEELSAQDTALEVDKKRYAELKAKQEDITKKLAAIIQSDPVLKSKIINHLDDIIKLLHLAKEISATKLDDRLVKTSTVKKFKDIELPDNLKDVVQSFKNSVKDNIHFTEQDARDIAGAGATQEQISEVKAHGEAIFADGFALCNQLAQLEAMKMNYTLAQGYYEEEFAKIKQQFNENMKNIDNKSAAIVEIARKINTAENKEELKKGLFQLLDSDVKKFTEKDWTDFLNGDKIIEI